MCGAAVTGAAQESREYYGSALSGVRRVCPRLTFTDSGVRAAKYVAIKTRCQPSRLGIVHHDTQATDINNSQPHIHP